MLKEYRGFIIFLFLMVMFRGAVADWNEVPTGSMNPTIVEGDRIFVNKMAYDLRVPMTSLSLIRLDEPQRGDIVVFDSEASGKTMVKRLIGLPGDRVSMKGNRLTINGQAARYSLLDENQDKAVLLEQAGDQLRRVQLSKSPSSNSSFDVVVVPDEHYLVLGDNRDNSADSRFYGFIPREELRGRASHVVVSLDYDNFYLPRGERTLKELL